MLDSLFRNTLSPVQWSILAAVPPAILALYFLKLRRQPVEVPSTYLWMRAIEDLHVNSLWQRLRQSLLLFLQLLMVALAILALLRPGWQGTRLTGRQFIFLVDNSASMTATDGDAAPDGSGGGATRLEVAKAKIAALIDQMERGMSAMIISFADSPRVVQQFTDNRRLLKERLASIEPTAGATDLEGALRLAGGVANPGQVVVDEEAAAAEATESSEMTLYLFTDGRFEAVQDFALGNLDPVYLPVGSEASANLAITSLNTRRNEARPEEKEAFVQVANYSVEARRIVVELSLNGSFLDARAAEAPAGGTASFTFPLADAPSGELVASIDRETLAVADDALALDNKAYAAINDADPGAILLVTPGNPVVETALDTSRVDRLGRLETVAPTALATPKLQQRLASGDFDLVIFDRCVPVGEPPMPRANTLFLGELPPTTVWRSEAGVVEADAEQEAVAEPQRVTGPQVIDWNRAHPLMAYLQIGDLLVGESLVVEPPLGGTALIDSTEGPLLSLAPRESFEDLVLGFPILEEVDGQTVANTTWFKSRSFPTFWLNVLDYLAADGQQRDAVRPGQTVEIRPKGRVAEVAVGAPNGETQSLKRSGGAPFIYQQTAEQGVYTVRAGEPVLERFAVNLFDAAESDIRLKTTGAGEGVSLDAIRIGYTDVAAASAQSPARKELWRLLLIGAIGVLVFEWYVYNRRAYL